MLNSTIVANINGGLSTNQKVSGGLRSSLLMPVNFTMTEVKTNTTAGEQRKLIQKSSAKGPSHTSFNGQGKSNSSFLDQNKNPQSKQMKLLNGNRNNVESTEDVIPLPKVCLYSGRINSEWQHVAKIGAGLVNLGNTCFLNTVLQCLTYCPPLANYLLHDSDHANKCRLPGFCMMCELTQHMKKAISRNGELVKPITIYHKLQSIARHFQFGRQEDAHEFLRYIIDHLWKACLSSHEGYTKLDPASKETTVINQIFGGYYRSQVTCLRCKEKSNTYDHFMDLMLDIRIKNEIIGPSEQGCNRKGTQMRQNVHTLEKALDRYIQPELLQNDNAYKCPKCKMKVSAHKRFTVFKAPNVATFQFKRFDYHRICGGKITKHIGYPENLNLRPYMSNPKGGPVLYRLNAVLVHLGSTCNSGHYFCYVRNSNGFWYIMDDVRVSQVSLNQVLNQNAYVLFYVRVNPSDSLAAKKATDRISVSMKNGFVGSGHGASSPNVSRPLMNVKPTALQGISKLSVSGLSNGTTIKTPNKPNLQPLPQKRGKIAFTVNSSSNVNIMKHAAVNKLPVNNAKNLISSSSKGIVNGNTLVPYVEDSSDFSDDDDINQNRQNVIGSKNGMKAPVAKTSILTKEKDKGLKNNNSLACPNNSPRSTDIPTKDTTVPQKEATILSREPKISSLPTKETWAVSPNETKVSSVPPRETNVSSLSLKETKVSSLSPKISTVSSRETATISENVTNKLTEKQDGETVHSAILPAPEKSKIASMEERDVNKASSSFILLNQLPSASNAKVNATSSWTVTEINHQSPSIASGSSTNSVNSTTDWTTTDQEQAQKKNLDGHIVGSISIRRPEKRLSLNHGNIKAKIRNLRMYSGKEGKASCSSVKSMALSDKAEKLDVPCKDDYGSSKLSKSPVNASAPNLSQVKVDATEKGKPESHSPKSHSKPDLTSRLEKEDQPPFRNQPFHAPSSRESFLGDRRGISPASTSKHEEQDSCKRPLSDDTQNASSERTSQFPDHHEDSNGPVRKKFKAEPYKSEREHSSVIKPGSAIRTKDNDHTSQHFRTSSDSSLSTSHQTNVKKHKRSFSDKDNRTNGLQKKSHDSDSDESSNSKYELTWVEKKNEYSHAASASGVTSRSHSEGKQENTRTGRESLSDGRADHHKSRDVVSELQRNSNHLFGADVGSWNNTRRSPIRENKPRQYFDDYDDELDKGKVRRSKKHQYERNQYRYNPFQAFQNDKRQNRDGFENNNWRSDKYHHKDNYHQNRYYNDDNRQHKNYHNKYYQKSRFNNKHQNFHRR